MVEPNDSSGVGKDFLFINHWLEEVQQAMVLKNTDTENSQQMIDKRNGDFHNTNCQNDLEDSLTNRSKKSTNSFRRGSRKYKYFTEDQAENRTDLLEENLTPDDIYCELNAEELRSVQKRFCFTAKELKSKTNVNSIAYHHYALEKNVDQLSLDDRRSISVSNQPLLVGRRGSTGQLTSLSPKRVSSAVSRHLSPRPDTPAYVMPCERVFLPPLRGSEKRRHSIHDIPVTIYDEEEVDSDEEGNTNSLPTVPEADGSPGISYLREANPRIIHHRHRSLPSVSVSTLKYHPPLQGMVEDKTPFQRRVHSLQHTGPPRASCIVRHRSKSLEGGTTIVHQRHKQTLERSAAQYDPPESV